MSAGSELHILAPKRGNLAVAQARLDGEKQQRPVPPANPCLGVGSCCKGGNLFLGEKLDGITFITLGGDRENTLAGHVPVH